MPVPSVPQGFHEEEPYGGHRPISGQSPFLNCRQGRQKMAASRNSPARPSGAGKLRRNVFGRCESGVPVTAITSRGGTSWPVMGDD